VERLLNATPSAAMITSVSLVRNANTGGIDLNEKMLNLETQGDSTPVLHWDRAMGSNGPIQGFFPVVIKNHPYHQSSRLFSQLINN